MRANGIELLLNRLRLSTHRAVDAFSDYIKTVEHTAENDLAMHYKQPMMFLVANKRDKAIVILDFIMRKYFRANGDFANNEHQKSNNAAYQEFYTYTNGWILRAANILNQSDIINRGLNFLSQFHDTDSGGFFTHYPTGDGITDIITTAHLGLLYLEMNQIEIAKSCGDYLCRMFKIQPNITLKFFLRQSHKAVCITDFPETASPIHVIDKSQPNQLYFMMAYPIAFLVELYKKTHDEKFLLAATQYADFLLHCHSSVLSCEFSHKFAWALSKLYALSSNNEYLSAVEKIVDYFVSIQNKNGLWFSDDPLKCYDQSAEIVCWFLQITENLSLTLKNYTGIFYPAPVSDQSNQLSTSSVQIPANK